MRRQQRDSVTAFTAVTGVAGVLFGVIVGYMLGVNQGTAGAAAPVAAQTAVAAPAAGVVNEQELQAYRNVLASDPKNVRANVEIANRLYDAGRYGEAIAYYQQAVTLDPKDVNVSTDYATALYYAGRVDEALAQFDKSLSIDPKHGQTLFNLGIVRRDGKHDLKGAAEAWERLLAANPNYPDSARVRTMIEESRRGA
jgi:tetratricopeptide (TPR) repeat protein